MDYNILQQHREHTNWLNTFNIHHFYTDVPAFVWRLFLFSLPFDVINQLIEYFNLVVVWLLRNLFVCEKVFQFKVLKNSYLNKSNTAQLKMFDSCGSWHAALVCKVICWELGRFSNSVEISLWKFFVSKGKSGRYKWIFCKIVIII